MKLKLNVNIKKKKADPAGEYAPDVEKKKSKWTKII